MPSRINELLLAQYKKAFRGAGGIVSIGYEKMGVAVTHELRGKLAAQGYRLLFVKNRIARLALKELGAGGDTGLLTDRQSAFAWGGDDPVSLARLLVDFQKRHPELVLHGAWVDGVAVGAAGAKDLSESPTRPELQSRLSGQIMEPGRAVASAIGAPAALLAAQIKTLVENREKEAGVA